MTNTTMTAEQMAKTLALPVKSAEFFADLARDAGNWSGTPWLTGNVSAGRSSSAMSQTLERHGLLVVEHGGDDGEGAYAVFTRHGVEAAKRIGIDLSYLSERDLSEPKGEPKFLANDANDASTITHEISDDASANRKSVRSTKSAALRKASADTSESKPDAANRKGATKTTSTKTTSATTPAKATSVPTTAPAIKLPKGFTFKYDNGAYQLAKRGEGAAETAPKWLVICTEHGTTHDADAAKEGDALGRKSGRVAWCKSCKSAASKSSK